MPDRNISTVFGTWAFAHAGTYRQTGIYKSVLLIAIANNLNPYFYLSYLFTEAPKMAANGVDWVTAMLPHNAPASCKAEKKDRGQY